MPKRKNIDENPIKKTMTTIYRSLIDHSNTTEIDYFQSMNHDEQSKIIDELKMILFFAKSSKIF